jgi:hypothetical protein
MRGTIHASAGKCCKPRGLTADFPDAHVSLECSRRPMCLLLPLTDKRPDGVGQIPAARGPGLLLSVANQSHLQLVSFRQCTETTAVLRQHWPTSL